MRARLNLKAGFAATGFPLSLSCDAGFAAAPLGHDGGGVYVGAVSVTPTVSSGNWALTASVFPDGGLRATTTFVTDTTAPVLTVTALPRPGAMADADPSALTAWKKDEKALVRVEVDDATVTVGTSAFTVAWGGAVTATGAACGCGGGNCHCFEVDLSKAPLAAVRGTVAVQVGPVADAYGNVSNTVTPSIPVTRWRWARALGTVVSAPLPVAISQDGKVMLGTAEVGTHRISAFDQGGALLWAEVNTGALTAGPVVSINNVYVATRTGANAAIQPFALTTGGPGVPQCPSTDSTSYLGDMALATVSNGATGVEAPVAVRNDQLRVGDGTCNASVALGLTGRPTLVVQEDGGVSTGGSLDAFATGDGAATLWKANLLNQAWALMGTASEPVVPAYGLFLTGTRLGGGGGGVTSGGAWTTSSAGTFDAGQTFSSYSVALAPQAGPPSVGADYVLYGDSSGRLVKLGFVSGNLTTELGAQAVASGANRSTRLATPIIGKFGLVYVLAANGTLAVRAASNLTEAWTAVGLVGAPDAISQPALDVYRDTSGVKQCNSGLGVLYLASATSGVATLTAILVDSEGLDATAPWPKYQRDNANTGNASRPLAPWTCP